MSRYASDNVFAKILRGEMDCHRVFEDSAALAFMDIMPRADGHVLVVPKAPARNLLDAKPQDLAALITRVQTVAVAVKTAMQADGITLQQFNETAGGQIVFHLHFHVLPRWSGIVLRPHTGVIEKPEILAAHAAKIRAHL
jgi:histidine triad (HIT) family protein